ncbi:Tn7-like element transposition protein TnsE [Paenibacillus tyrfis]|uniref:Tn7-like element transposition protein TnsE n=1 Tax=Paenibacillus tyrfis TaxID=1501230 RepID=UPI0020A1F4FF|nr:Tn7-like element transposition protein TnsE [Paenibacillus tyrfis]MCP1312593.1 Tn7-like element transposition protein TnsE [Paenibacillus tyrfis]
MCATKFRRWPFDKGETVELCWTGSLFTGVKGDWRINVAFRRSDKSIAIIDHPVGVWPILRLGQIYTDNAFEMTRPMAGIVETIQVTDIRQGQLVFGFDVPSKLLYLDKQKELGKQFVWKYEDNGLEYYVPMMEWARCLFIKNRTLAYLVLQPHGLEQIFENVKQRDETMYIDFNRRLPVTIAQNKDSALHIAWIHGNGTIRNSWDSIYSYLFRAATKKDNIDPKSIFRKGIALKFELPQLDPCEMMVRCIRKGNQVLVQEIMGISNLKLPAEKLVYSHPIMKKQIANDGPKKTRITDQSEQEEFEITDDNDFAKENTYQDVLDVPPTFYGFVQKPEIIIDRKERQKVNSGDGVILPIGRGGKNQNDGVKEVSVEDTSIGGEVPPIEFESLQAVLMSEGIGLEEFFKVISKLIDDYGLNIKMSIFQLPLGKRYSVCDNGVRRTCAVAQVTTAVSKKYILEMARPDGWSISTLILTNEKKLTVREIEKNIKYLLEEVVKKGGHWDQYILNGCTLDIQKLKHYQNDSIAIWAERIFNKMHE